MEASAIDAGERERDATERDAAERDARANEGMRIGIEIIASDSGPGIEDIEKALEDGYSSGGGLGIGLGGIKRLMDEFEIWSKVGEGTKVRVVKWMKT